MMNEKIETYNLFMDRPCARTSDKRSGRVDCYNKWTKTFEVKNYEYTVIWDFNCVVAAFPSGFMQKADNGSDRH